jgi:hypothetical protein
MNTSTYSTSASKFGNVQLLSITVDNEVYYPIYLLPMDEKGINGFPTTQVTVEGDITTILTQACTGDIDEELSDEIEALVDTNPNLHSFAVEGIQGKVPCLDTVQLTEVVLSYAHKKDCDFCWDLLDVFFFEGLE